MYFDCYRVRPLNQNAIEIQATCRKTSFIPKTGKRGSGDLPLRHAWRPKHLNAVDVDHATVIQEIFREPLCFRKLFQRDLKRISKEVSRDQILTISRRSDTKQEILCSGKPIDTPYLDGHLF